MKAPIWFTTWSEKEFKPLIQDVKILKQDVSDIKAQVGVLEKNVNTIYDILDRNNLK
jgi:hypothetical protein